MNSLTKDSRGRGSLILKVAYGNVVLKLLLAPLFVLRVRRPRPSL